jgi:hypothetical protein
VERFDDAAVAAKIEAIGCYQSQISTFWPDLMTMANQVRADMADGGSGDYIERYWLQVE